MNSTNGHAVWFPVPCTDLSVLFSHYITTVCMCSDKMLRSPHQKEKNNRLGLHGKSLGVVFSCCIHVVLHIHYVCFLQVLSMYTGLVHS